MKEVVFRVTSVGKIQDQRLDFEMRGAYDLWWDSDDEQLLALLQLTCPTIEWNYFIFWKKQDHSSIRIIDPDEEEEVGSIRIRSRIGGDPVGEIDWTNVVMPIQFWKNEREGGQG